MWNSLRQTDIDRAKQVNAFRRAETLRRHAAEIETLEAGLAEIANLARLADVFAERYKRLPLPAAEPIIVVRHEDDTAHKPRREPRRHHPRDYVRTNFDAFSRAVSKATF